MSKTINIFSGDWQAQTVQLSFDNHLICTGKQSDLQWFGTQLIQELGGIENSQTSPIYGKLITNMEQLCYQLCHATPWGFEMGTNWNAVQDVIRGEGNPQHKFFVVYDAEHLYQNDYDSLKTLLEIFLEVGEEYEALGRNLKCIFLIEDKEQISLRKLLRRKEKYPIELLTIIQNDA